MGEAAAVELVVEVGMGSPIGAEQRVAHRVVAAEGEGASSSLQH